jgi:hypothetical protein
MWVPPIEVGRTLSPDVVATQARSALDMGERKRADLAASPFSRFSQCTYDKTEKGRELPYGQMPVFWQRKTSTTTPGQSEWEYTVPG